MITAEPIWHIWAGQIFVALIVVLCAWLLKRRVDFFTRILLKQAIDTAEERKTLAIKTAAELDKQRAADALAVGKKLEDAAASVSDTAVHAAAEVKEAVATAAVTASETLSSEMQALREDLKNQALPPAATAIGRVDKAVMELVEEKKGKGDAK